MRLYVLALIELARQIQAEEAANDEQPRDGSLDVPATSAKKQEAGT